jgi:hypothetical protein
MEKEPNVALGGGVKKDVGKLRMDLLPAYPISKLAEVYTIGAAKYGDHNYRKGMAWSRIFGALLRHAFAWWSGEKFDRVDGQHHLAAVAWCALSLMQYELDHPGLDDRYKEKNDQSLQSS